jgi:hypothetical protein
VKEIVMNAQAEHTQTPPRGHRVLWTVIGIVGGLVVLIPVAFYLVVVVAFSMADRAQPTVGEAYTAAQHYYKTRAIHPPTQVGG